MVVDIVQNAGNFAQVRSANYIKKKRNRIKIEIEEKAKKVLASKRKRRN